MRDLVRSFLSDERGATTVEYAILAVVICIAAYYGIYDMIFPHDGKPPILVEIFNLAMGKIANFGSIE